MKERGHWHRQTLASLVLCTFLASGSISVSEGADLATAVPPEGASPVIEHADVEAQAAVPGSVSEFTVYFDSEESAQGLDGLDRLNEFARQLKESRVGRAVLTAFLETQELSSYSLAIAHARMQQVAKRLQILGVAPRQIHARVHYDPPGTLPCKSESCLASYRRIGVSLVIPQRAKPAKKRTQQ